jgi:hypothetical protein
MKKNTNENKNTNKENLNESHPDHLRHRPRLLRDLRQLPRYLHGLNPTEIEPETPG